MTAHARIKVPSSAADGIVHLPASFLPTSPTSSVAHPIETLDFERRRGLPLTLTRMPVATRGVAATRGGAAHRGRRRLPRDC
jgi:hypothetical protein